MHIPRYEYYQASMHIPRWLKVRHNNITVLKPAHLPLAKAASRVHSSVAKGLRVVRHNNESDTAINTVMIASVDTKKLQSH